MNKTKLLIANGVLAFSSLAVAQNVSETLERAVQLQQIEGKHNEAIHLYLKVIDRGESLEDVVAEAHFRLAECYNKLGDREKAISSIENLQRVFPADNQWVKKASLLHNHDVNFLENIFAQEGGEYHGYEVVLLDGSVIGSMNAAIIENEYEGVRTLQSFASRSFGGMQSSSTCIFRRDGYQTIVGQSYIRGFGNVVFEHFKNGKSTGKNYSTGAKLAKVAPPKGFSNIYDNDQIIQLLRAVPYQLDQVFSIPFRNPVNGAVINLELTATEKLQVKVFGKEYDCFKINSNINQTFYVTVEEPKLVVRMDLPGAKALLKTVEDYDATVPRKLKSKALPIRFDLPEGSIFHPPTDKKDIFRLDFNIGDMTILHGLLEVTLTKNIPLEVRKSSKRVAEWISAKEEKQFDSRALDSESWEEMTIDGIKSIIVRSDQKQGEVETSTWQAYGMGEKYLVILRCDFDRQFHGSDVAKERLLEVLQSIKIGSK